MFGQWITIISMCLAFLGILPGGGNLIPAQNTEIESSGPAAFVLDAGNIQWLPQDEPACEMTEQGYQEHIRLSPEEEAAIVHRVPPCPVIIDGVRYEPEQIHLFDGGRLWFTSDFGNVLYAFTTEKGIDEFHRKQIALLSGIKNRVVLRSGYSYFFEDMNYGGTMLAVPAGYPGGYVPNLDTMDNAISSFQLDGTIYKASLFEDTDYGGDVFERVGGTCITSLWIFGWNDRASSIIVYD